MSEECKSMSPVERQKLYEINMILDGRASGLIDVFLKDKTYEPAKVLLSNLWELYRRHFPQELTAQLMKDNQYEIPDGQELLDVISPNQIWEHAGDREGILRIQQIFKDTNASIQPNQ